MFTTPSPLLSDRLLSDRLWPSSGCAIACSLLLGAIAPDAQALEPAEIASQVRASVVRIVPTATADKPGTGSLIDEEDGEYLVLTCYHTIDNETDYEVETADGQRHNLKLNSIERVGGTNLGLARFRARGAYQTVALGEYLPLREGDGIFIAGFVQSHLPDLPPTFRFSDGAIASILSEDYPYGYGFLHTSATHTGMGGAPILDRDGRLVGVHCGSEQNQEAPDQPTGFGFGISIEHMRDRVSHRAALGSWRSAPPRIETPACRNCTSDSDATSSRPAPSRPSSLGLGQRW